MNNQRKNEKGITLIALVITIVVLLILAGISINMLTGENGILEQSKSAKLENEKAQVTEKLKIKILEAETSLMKNGGGQPTIKEVSEYLQEKNKDIDMTIEYKETASVIIIDNNILEPKSAIITFEGWEFKLKENLKIDETYTKNIGITDEDKEQEEEDDKVPEINDEEVNNSGGGNNNSGETIVIDGSWNGTLHTPKLKNTGLTAVYWNETTSKWIELTEESTEDEWKNWYNYADTSVTGSGTSKWANARSADGSMWVWIPRYEYKIDSTNKTIDVKFIEIGKDISSGYILHPAFGTDISNGGWSTDLPGFWVAKYEAGFQNSTVGEETKTVQSSPTLKYTTVNATSTYQTNFFGIITANSTALTYPVFKANTYSYNLISTGDAWLLSQEIDTASMYGLSNVDSHMLKNSEWGAVAYLAHSKYGVNGNSTNMNEVTKNSKDLNDTTNNIYAVTSYGVSDTANDVNASSTKNMTGVFDFNGGTLERVAGFLQGENATTPDWHSAMADGNTIKSTKYLTLYTEDNKVGDAMNETAEWNSDGFEFAISNYPTFYRGGCYSSEGWGGVFSYAKDNGNPWIACGFRVCLGF